MILGLWKNQRTPTIAQALGSTSTYNPKAGLSKAKQWDVEEIFDSDTEPESGDDEVEVIESVATGWLYVGSHNFTPSAW